MTKRLPYTEKAGTEEAEALGDSWHWEFILAVKLKMSWGFATLNLARKRTEREL